AQLERIARDAGNPVAGPHLDVAGRVGRGVVRAECGERRLECRIDVGVSRGEARPAGPALQRELETLAARVADVLEESRVDRGAARADELDIVGKIGP